VTLDAGSSQRGPECPGTAPGQQLDPRQLARGGARRVCSCRAARRLAPKPDVLQRRSIRPRRRTSKAVPSPDSRTSSRVLTRATGRGPAGLCGQTAKSWLADRTLVRIKTLLPRWRTMPVQAPNAHRDGWVVRHVVSSECFPRLFPLLVPCLVKPLLFRAATTRSAA
jgi:hypothetical protein